ncbi:hypothetical protein DPSP01_000453 [Paraphaeosphaeria sporulosa]
MYHTDTQVFQRLHSYPQSPQVQTTREEPKSTMAPDIGGAMEREKRAVEGISAGKASDREDKHTAEKVAKRVP